MAPHVTPADASDRDAVDDLTGAVQAVTEGSVEKAFVDQGYTGERATSAAARHGIEPDVARLPEAKRGFVLSPRRWVVERSLAWATRFRSLVKDYERLSNIVEGLHLVAFACPMLKNVAQLMAGS